MPLLAVVGKGAARASGIFQGIPSEEMAVRGRYSRRAILGKRTGESAERSRTACRHQASCTRTYAKTYYFFLLIENKEFTKIFNLTGNDLETSELLHSAMFYTNQKNAFLIHKSNVFLFRCQNNFIEKRRKSDF